MKNKAANGEIVFRKDVKNKKMSETVNCLKMSLYLTVLTS